MFKILDGREQFYQWDVDRKVIVNDPSISTVHFCNRTDNCSLVCPVYEEDGLNVADVPNIILQMDWRIKVYGYSDTYTKHEACFDVVSRSKPADYIYTETEVLTYEALEKRIENLEEGGSGDIDLTEYAKKEYVDKAIEEAINSIPNGDEVYY